MTETDIANYSLGKIGGAGDQINGNAFLSSIDDSDKVSSWCKTVLPICRKKIITDLARLKAPFRETLIFKDLGNALNEGNLPETGQWLYAFNLPGDCLAVVMQFDESYINKRDNRNYQYEYDVILNKAGNGRVLLTNNLSNYGGTSAFIAYVIDQTNTGTYSQLFIECLATLLAAEICPVIGKDIPTRKNMLAEYKQICVPDAAGFNGSQFWLSKKTRPNYLGGRNETLHSV